MLSNIRIKHTMNLADKHAIKRTSTLTIKLTIKRRFRAKKIGIIWVYY